DEADDGYRQPHAGRGRPERGEHRQRHGHRRETQEEQQRAAIAPEAVAQPAGKIADIAAARLTLKPRKSRMYAGVQVLNVSRTIVVAKLSRQTIRKARLRSSGSTRAAKVLGRDSAPEKTLRGFAIASG